MNTESGLKPSIKLGFVETIEEPLMPSDFPSKVGGKPVWLVPEYLPLSEEMLCGVCQTPLSFLLQIYAPFDIPEAYHRTIYVFCCKNGACHRKPTQRYAISSKRHVRLIIHLLLSVSKYSGLSYQKIIDIME
jgi:hypothetical protein